MLWLEEDTNFVKTEHEVMSSTQGVYVREDAMFSEKTGVEKKVC